MKSNYQSNQNINTKQYTVFYYMYNVTFMSSGVNNTLYVTGRPEPTLWVLFVGLIISKYGDSWLVTFSKRGIYV